MASTQNDPIASAVSLAKSRTSGATLEYWQPRLEALLAAQGDARGTATVEDMTLPADGGSSGTILFTARYNDIVGDGSSDALVLRFEPEVGQMHEADIAGQYRVLKALEQTDVPSPQVLARRQMIEGALDALAKIHRVDWGGLGIDKVTRQGKGNNWLEKDLDWYLAALRHGSPEAEADVRPVFDWLLDHQFEPSVVSL